MTGGWRRNVTRGLMAFVVLTVVTAAGVLGCSSGEPASETIPAPHVSAAGNGAARVTLTLGRAIYVATAHGQGLRTVTLTGTGAPGVVKAREGPGLAVFSRLADELLLETGAAPGVSLLSRLEEELELEADAVGKWEIELVAIHRQNATEERFFLPGPDSPSNALVDVFDLSGAVRILLPQAPRAPGPAAHQRGRSNSATHPLRRGSPLDSVRP